MIGMLKMASQELVTLFQFISLYGMDAFGAKKDPPREGGGPVFWSVVLFTGRWIRAR